MSSMIFKCIDLKVLLIPCKSRYVAVVQGDTAILGSTVFMINGYKTKSVSLNQRVSIS